MLLKIFTFRKESLKKKEKERKNLQGIVRLEFRPNETSTLVRSKNTFNIVKNFHVSKGKPKKEKKRKKIFEESFDSKLQRSRDRKTRSMLLKISTFRKKCLKKKENLREIIRMKRQRS